jgi:type VI secretion system secreted protein Hcp
MFTKRVTAVAMSLSIVLSAASAGAAFEAYIKIKGTKQGQIKTDSVSRPAKVSDDAIEILSFDMAIEAPRDASSGLATGKRQHKPLVITKEVDTASPKLLQAKATNEVFTSFVLVEPEAGVAGGTITATLTNARISAVTPIVPDAHHPGLDKTRKYESISVTFDRLDVQHAPSGKTESFAY